MGIVNLKENLRIGRGKLFVRTFDDSDDGDQGSSFDFQHQVTSAAYTPNEEKLTEPDATSGIGGILAEPTIGRKPTIKCTMKSFAAGQLANAMMGTLTIATQAATPVVAESHLNVKQGGYEILEKRGPATSIVVKDNGGATTYTLGDDYTVGENGFFVFIYIVPGGAIDTGTEIEVSYTPEAYTSWDQVAPGTKSEIIVELAFQGTEAYGANYNFRFWRASINIDGDREFIQPSAEFGSYDITFTLLNDAANHPTQPFGVIERVDNAVAA